MQQINQSLTIIPMTLRMLNQITLLGNQFCYRDRPVTYVQLYVRITEVIIEQQNNNIVKIQITDDTDFFEIVLNTSDQIVKQVLIHSNDVEKKYFKTICLVKNLQNQQININICALDILDFKQSNELLIFFQSIIAFDKYCTNLSVKDLQKEFHLMHIQLIDELEIEIANLFNQSEQLTIDQIISQLTVKYNIDSIYKYLIGLISENKLIEVDDNKYKLIN